MYIVKIYSRGKLVILGILFSPICLRFYNFFGTFLRVHVFHSPFVRGSSVESNIDDPATLLLPKKIIYYTN